MGGGVSGSGKEVEMLKPIFLVLRLSGCECVSSHVVSIV